MENQEYKIFSVSEIHGSELCYRKVLKLAICDERPDVLVLYGNITGNKVIPIIKAKRNNNGILRECKYEGMLKKYTIKTLGVYLVLKRIEEKISPFLREVESSFKN